MSEGRNSRLSKTQIDRLGDRLRSSALTNDDLRLLDEYRRTFGAAADAVVSQIRRTIGVNPTTRPAKSTSAIVEKLQRETIRLSQIQDIAGCRVVVRDIREQNSVVSRIRDLFADVSIVDRRRNPSHGYRAVHIIAKTEGRLVEIQIRTTLQHHWAEGCETSADEFGPEVKYGGGPTELRWALLDTSADISDIERQESIVARAIARLKVINMPRTSARPVKELQLLERDLRRLEASVASRRKKLVESMAEAIEEARFRIRTAQNDLRASIR